MRLISLFFLILLPLLFAARAEGASLTVFYEITGGSFLTHMPSGSVTGGSATVHFEVGLNSSITGRPATLRTLQITGTQNRLRLRRPMHGFGARGPGVLHLHPQGLSVTTGPALSTSYLFGRAIHFRGEVRHFTYSTILFSIGPFYNGPNTTVSGGPFGYLRVTGHEVSRVPEPGLAPMAAAALALAAVASALTYLPARR